METQRSLGRSFASPISFASVEHCIGGRVNLPNHNLGSLFASRPSSADIDLNLAAHYATSLKFDAREPCLPLAVAYRSFRKNTPSLSFPRRIELNEAERPGPELAIEYAIWWDLDTVEFCVRCGHPFTKREAELPVCEGCPP